MATEEPPPAFAASVTSVGKEAQLRKLAPAFLGVVVWMGLEFVLVSSFAMAQEADAEVGEHHEHRNEVAMFLGGTYETGEGENLFTIGGDYEFRFDPRVGVGVTVEYLEGGTGVFVFPVTFHWYRGLSVYGGPGWESEGAPEGAHDEEGGEEAEEDERRFLARVGVQYSLTFAERWAVIPTVAIDLVHAEHVERAIVYGVKLAVGF